MNNLLPAKKISVNQVTSSPDGKADEKCALAGVKAIQELLEFAD